MSFPSAPRYDYAFPLRMDPVSRQARRADYNAHVAQMIRQFLLTGPGERVMLPDFGSGLRQLLFAPQTDALSATTQLLVRRGLEKYLGDVIELASVEVTSSTTDPGAIEVALSYRVRETQGAERLVLEVR